MSSACPSCSSARVEAAQIDGAALTIARASLTRRVFNTGGQVFCSVCPDCGHIFGFRADPAKLADMLG